MKITLRSCLHLNFLSVSLLLLGVSMHLTPETHAGSAYEKQLLRLHNAERAKRNKRPLRLNAALSQSATKYAQVMSANNHFDHTGPAPEFSTLELRVKAECPTCFSVMAENIAFGQKTEKVVTKAWSKSPGHRRNILNGKLRFVGFGKAGTAPYWVTNFGG